MKNQAPSTAAEVFKQALAVEPAGHRALLHQLLWRDNSALRHEVASLLATVRGRLIAASASEE